MRDLVYYVAVSLDGLIADDEGGYDAFLVEGDHAAVVLTEYADALPGHVLGALGLTAPGTRFDTVVMGWETLQPALRAGIASPYPHLRQYVASRHPRPVAADVTLTADPVTTVRDLKCEDGLDVWLCGGGRLAGSLLAEVDRLVLKRNPVVLGSGVPLFAGVASAAHPFSLTDVRRFDSGVVVEEYCRA
ncbi:dihydrofolate reductase family protein [uncultured Nocardioides sp.]|uniref:dihydrofolate reductase family protein n=1 Tax=uncultured Nocardioides sp. TaxID=198441 RepID=UPI002622F823|nr:dihydrofolate reductase family protein [uncultured Nocardioides sp.]